MAVVGSDEAQVKEAALALSRELAPPDAGDFGVEIIDGIAENSDHASRICADALQGLQTLPFFGGEKLVWLKNVNFAADSVVGRAKATLEALDHLSEYLKAGVPEGVRFLISAHDIDKRRTFFKTLKSLADLRVFDKPDAGRDGWEAAMEAHVTARARDLGLRFSRDALEHFVFVAGEETKLVNNELEKLDLYLGPARRSVEVEDIEKVVSLGRSGIIFEIGNAIGRRNLAQAFDLVEHFLSRGENAIGLLLAAIVPKVRSLLLAKDIEERHRISGEQNYRSYEARLARLPEHETAHLPRKKDGGLSVYPIYLAAREAKQFSLEELKEALHACLDANVRLVSSGLDAKLVLQQLLAKILTRRESGSGRRSNPDRRAGAA